MSEEPQPLSFKVVFVGDPNVGKTSIIQRATSSEYFGANKPTISPTGETITVNIDSQEVNLNVWDTPGQTSYRNTTPFFIRGSNAIIFVYSLNEKNTYESIEEWHDFVLNHIDKDKVCYVLVANKSDLEGLHPNQVTDSEGKEKAKSLNMAFIKTSAKDNINIKELIELIGSECLKTNGNNGIDKSILNKENENNKKDCCYFFIYII